MFSDIRINENIDNDKLNSILKNLYDLKLFENIVIDFTNNILKISVIEFPIIEDIIFKGIKADKIQDEINKNVVLNQDHLSIKLFLLKIKNQFYLFEKSWILFFINKFLYRRFR